MFELRNTPAEGGSRRILTGGSCPLRGVFAAGATRGFFARNMPFLPGSGSKSISVMYASTSPCDWSSEQND